MRDMQRDRLMPAVAETLADAAVRLRDVDRIVCGSGPGSFTSLRIAAAIAKGLAMATGKPLFAVSSLALMVGAVTRPLAEGEYVAVLDALRGELYVASVLVGTGGEIMAVRPVTLVRSEELGASGRPDQLFVGAGRHIDATPNARGVVHTMSLLERDGPVDLASWEPDYGRVAEAQRRWEAAHGRAMPHA
jgi:tRNA threonylcarbamoyladenosine biosynthesis protein TsaB